MKIRYTKDRIIYKSKKGKIICTEDLLVAGARYILLDASGQYVKELAVPFRAEDYL